MWKPKKEMWGYTTEPLPHPQTGGRGPNGIYLAYCYRIHYGLLSWFCLTFPGRIWNFRRGGGLKKSYYMVDWYRGGPKDGKLNITIVQNILYWAVGEPLSERVVRIMEDKNRTAHLALVIGGERKRWIVATENMKVGDLIQSSQELTAKAGTSAYNMCLIVPFAGFSSGSGGKFLSSWFPGNGHSSELCSDVAWGGKRLSSGLCGRNDGSSTAEGWRQGHSQIAVETRSSCGPALLGNGGQSVKYRMGQHSLGYCWGEASCWNSA